MLKTLWLFRSLLPRWLCGVQDFVGTKNCLAEEDVQILEPTEIGPAAAADAGENEEEMCRIQSENTTNFIVSLNFGLPCECDTIWLSKSPGSCVGMRICFVSTSSIIPSRIVCSQNGP